MERLVRVAARQRPLGRHEVRQGRLGNGRGAALGRRPWRGGPALDDGGGRARRGRVHGDGRLRRLQWRGASVRRLRLSEAVLRGLCLRGTCVRRLHLRRAVLRGLCLRAASVRRLHLRRAVLSGLCLRRAILSGLHLRGAGVRGLRLREAGRLGRLRRGTGPRALHQRRPRHGLRRHRQRRRSGLRSPSPLRSGAWHHASPSNHTEPQSHGDGHGADEHHHRREHPPPIPGTPRLEGGRGPLGTPELAALWPRRYPRRRRRRRGVRPGLRAVSGRLPLGQRRDLVELHVDNGALRRAVLLARAPVGHRLGLGGDRLRVHGLALRPQRLYLRGADRHRGHHRRQVRGQ
ncbi:pentapeptide repeat-containing protein [Pyxidicoccus trucidator]|uniref:pentapeptide repeat-containing protein n=1 Tax=Pyxidicoccus trucidator TaxID=2709662 RepID=UPI003B835288